jgi:hypothetical protein
MKRLFITGAVFAGITPVAAQMIQAPGAPATEAYLHENSGIVLPVEAGELKRFRITRGPLAQDINAGYFHADPAAQLSAIVFVEEHPGADNCRKIADAERLGLQKSHPGASFSDLTPPPAPGYSALAFSSRYDAPKDGRGAADNYYYCAGPWIVEYAFQHLTAFDAAMLEAGFLRDLKLPPAQKP